MDFDCMLLIIMVFGVIFVLIQNFIVIVKVIFILLGFEEFIFDEDVGIVLDIISYYVE